MRVLPSLLLGIVLCGCSLGGYVGGSSFEYNQTLADVSNQQLVINILRARDNLPLEFSDLSQIRGSIQATASLQSSYPFGPLRGNTSTRGSEQATASVQMNPTFDIAPLNTQDFTKGTLQPIDPNYVTVLSEQGVPTQILLPLFVASIEKHEITAGGDENVTIYQNIPCFVPTKPKSLCPMYNFIQILSDQIFTIAGDYQWIPLFHSYSELTPVGVPVASIDPKFLPNTSGSPQFEIKTATILAGPNKGKPGSQIYEVKPQTAACRAKVKIDSKNPAAIKTILEYQSLDGNNKDRCYKSEVPAPPAVSAMAPGVRYKFNMRSPQAMVHYLGQLMALPDDAPMIFLISKGSPKPSDDVSITVTYQGDEYFVKQAKPEPSIGPYSYYNDDTMRILSIVTQMFNVYKNASEIPATKAVQGVP